MKNKEPRDFGPRTEEILDTAYDFLESLPYKTTLRKVFYRLKALGIYQTKKDYRAFMRLTIDARKDRFKEWTPATFVDPTRKIHDQSGWFLNEQEALEYYSYGVKVHLEHFYYQDCYIECWVESDAMLAQFLHMTQDVTVVPFRGDTSISQKWESAKRIDHLSERYGIPIHILYFGDCDKRGQRIPESAIRDVKEWANVEFDFIPCGLNKHQAEEYDLPENIETPGEWEWEALTEDQSQEILEEQLSLYIDDDKLEEIRDRESVITEKIQEAIREIEV